MQDLNHLAIIWVCVFLSSYFARLTKLTSVVYFLAFGCLMVNTGVLPEETTPFIEGFAKVGIIVIMFALGFEENSSKFVDGIKRAWGIALFGAIGPFAVAYFLSLQFWGDVKLALMCGLAMTATAVSLTMVSLRSEGLHRTDAARGIMTSAVLDDIASLALVALLVPLATGHSEISFDQVLLIGAKTLLFFGIVTLLGMWVFPCNSSIKVERLVPLWKKLSARFPVLGRHKYGIPVLERYGVRNLLMLGESGHSTLVILILAILISLVAHSFGFHPAVGAYMAGLILKQEHFHENQQLQAQDYDHCKMIIDDVAFSWLGPVFFVNLGTKIVLDLDIVTSVIPEMLALTIGVFTIQVISAMLAARYTGSFAWHESIMIGFGMLGRAELAFVVLDIGYVQNDIFTTAAFYTLMFTAFWLNIAVPLTIKYWRPYFIGEKQLAIRLGSRQIVLSNPEKK
ncbi:MAG TPA: cation:proton antiporter [Crenotrichaceae bacterium]|nr:cation:proton antiporter [Crenotrichaceae bacterium]